MKKITAKEQKSIFTNNETENYWLNKYKKTINILQENKKFKCDLFSLNCDEKEKLIEEISK